MLSVQSLCHQGEKPLIRNSFSRVNWMPTGFLCGIDRFHWKVVLLAPQWILQVMGPHFSVPPHTISIWLNWCCAVTLNWPNKEENNPSRRRHLARALRVSKAAGKCEFLSCAFLHLELGSQRDTQACLLLCEKLSCQTIDSEAQSTAVKIFPIHQNMKLPSKI